MCSVLSRMARECHLSEEGKHEMENVRGLHGPEQGLPKGQFPPTEDRLASRLYSRA